jgi:xylulokinase
VDGGGVGIGMTGGRSGAPDDRVAIGIDIGTTNSKGVACLADGAVIASARLEHGVSTPHPGWFEHDAEGVWWADVVELCRRLMAEIGPQVSVAAVAVTTCGPCVVPVDVDGRPLRPAILYGVDTRAGVEIAAFHERPGRRAIQRLSRMPLSSQSVGPKIAWVVANEPDVARRTALWHTATSWIVARLTGVAAIDHHQGSYFAPFIDARRRAWDFRFATGLGLEGRLPSLRWAGETAGGVTPGAAAETGLPVGTPVVIGTSDGPTEALAVGASRPGIVAITYGSTTTLTTFGAPAGRRNDLWESEGWSPERRCVGAGLATSGAIVDWLRREFARELPDPALAAVPPEDAHAVLAREAAAAPVGANGLLVLPYFSGERTPIADPLTRGVVVGLTPAHTRADLHRAILEGIAFGVRHILEAFAAAGIPVEQLRAAGGGTRSPLGMQIVSDVTGHEQVLPRETIGAAFGAAHLAARAGGMIDAGGDVGDGDAWFEPAGRIQPDPQLAAAYERRYALFRRLYRDTRAVVHALAVRSA